MLFSEKKWTYLGQKNWLNELVKKIDGLVTADTINDLVKVSKVSKVYNAEMIDLTFRNHQLHTAAD